MKTDLLIRGGLVVDGSGGEPAEGDVAVQDGRILAVGKLGSWSGVEEIDARGRLVTPGFVDLHTHYDAQVTFDSRLDPSSDHGVTSVVMGNCGVGFAPCRPADHQRLIQLMEGVDMPEVVLAEGLPWTWTSFPEYLDVLASRSFDLDVAAQVPHAALRVFVMGERASERETATAEDCAAMARIVGEALDAGAIGFGTSRSINHRASTGENIPTLKAAEAEMLAISRAMGERGRGVIQGISDFMDVDAEFSVFRAMAEASRRPLSLSVMQMHHHPETWRKVLSKIEACNADGLQVRAQVTGRPVVLMLGFHLSYNPFQFTPTFKKLRELTPEARLRELRRPEVREAIVDEEPLRDNFIGVQALRKWELMYPAGDAIDYEPDRSTNVAARAAQMGIRPEELAYDLMLGRDGKEILVLPVVNYAYGTLDAAREMLVHPNSVYGLGDEGAHVGFICDASLPTYMLQYWTRERSSGRLAVQEVVRGLTHDTATAVGLNDRGLIRPGYKADLNVIDYDRLSLCLPEVRNDLPAGGRRILQRATGYDATIVSGRITQRRGEPTGALPGRLVRGGQAAPAA